MAKRRRPGRKPGCCPGPGFEAMHRAKREKPSVFTPEGIAAEQVARLGESPWRNNGEQHSGAHGSSFQQQTEESNRRLLRKALSRLPERGDGL